MSGQLVLLLLPPITSLRIFLSIDYPGHSVVRLSVEVIVIWLSSLLLGFLYPVNFYLAFVFSFLVFVVATMGTLRICLMVFVADKWDQLGK